MANNTGQADIAIVEHHGSVVVLELNTPEARVWVAEHVVIESWQWLGNYRFACEPRLAVPLLEGAIDEGLSVEA